MVNWSFKSNHHSFSFEYWWNYHLLSSILHHHQITVWSIFFPGEWIHFNLNLFYFSFLEFFFLIISFTLLQFFFYNYIIHTYFFFSNYIMQRYISNRSLKQYKLLKNYILLLLLCFFGHKPTKLSLIDQTAVSILIKYILLDIIICLWRTI